MSIRPVREVPRPGLSQPKESFVAKDMREFLRTGMRAAVIEHDGRKTRSVENAVRGYIRAHQRECAGVKVGIRKDKVYVWRED